MENKLIELYLLVCRLYDTEAVLKHRRHANRARVAAELADTGFCSTKQTHYREMKLHLLAARRPKCLPLPERLALSSASQYDLSVLRELNPQQGAYALFADKAYSDADTKAVLKVCGTYLLTPYKRRRNESVTDTPTLYNHFVSSMR